MQPTRPSSANARLRSGGPVDDVAPRIGSFEVLVTLVNRLSGQKYGPVQVHSKLQTRRWPLFDKLRERVDVYLQEFLAKDTGHYEFHQAKERASQAISAQQAEERAGSPGRGVLLASELPDGPTPREGGDEQQQPMRWLGEEATQRRAQDHTPRLAEANAAQSPRRADEAQQQGTQQSTTATAQVVPARDERPLSAPQRRAVATPAASTPTPDGNGAPLAEQMLTAEHAAAA